jgi:hypothetical protein
MENSVKKSVKWEYLTKFPEDIKEKIDAYIAANPTDDAGRKNSYNKVINKLVTESLNRQRL